MVDNIQKCLNICNTLYIQHENILNSYVSDYYIEDHWNKLQNSWKSFLEKTDLREIGVLLDFSKPLDTKVVYPLSLLCLRNVIIEHSIPRQHICMGPASNTDEIFLKAFWKGVKEKKQHEISIMSKVCHKTALCNDTYYLVDIGSGLGHLSRMLSFGYGFRVCTLEANKNLSDLAFELDNQFKKTLQKKKIQHHLLKETVHINLKIELDIKCDEFVSIIKDAFNIKNNFKFGIIGLHPCGNLGSTLLRLYNECDSCSFINIVSCCYMKLTLSPTKFPGFPMSNYCKSQDFKLSYLSCEVACHSIENYAQKLIKNDYSSLKIHAFRAALEKVLDISYPQLKHSQLSGCKYEADLTFREFCKRALRRIDYIRLPEYNLLIYDDIIKDTWKNVVSFYSMRLILAPVIETIILLDRLLYLIETKSDGKIIPIFDCIISPRNHIISANKIYT